MTRSWFAGLGLALALAVPSAQAQDPRFALVEQNETFMSIVDMDEIEQATGTVRVAAALVFFPHTHTGVLPGASFDVMSTVGEYDCAEPRKWRALGVRAYENKPPLEKVFEEGQSPWTKAGATSPHDAIWKAVCLGQIHTTKLVFPRGTSAQMLLDGYRNVNAR